jgi:hypothetical protein
MNQELSPPPGFIIYDYEREFHYKDSEIEAVWKRLQRRETFTKGQIFPYQVEFVSPSQEGEFAPGELNIHHGPLLSVQGTIGEVTGHYRSLDYIYGSYVLTFRLVRPVKLEFFRNENKLRLRLRSYVRPWFLPFWQLGNFCLWSSFRLTL